mgnify:CR=1 FL=1
MKLSALHPRYEIGQYQRVIDELVPRADAKVSVFDSSVQGGDAVWEGLRVYRGRIAMFEES